MKIQIGIQHVARELELDVEASAEDLAASVETALAGNTPLRLTDVSGKSVIIPAGVLGYVSTSAAEKRPVGFGFAN